MDGEEKKSLILSVTLSRVIQNSILVPGCFSIVWLAGLRCDYAKINIFFILENPRNTFSRKIYENIILQILMLKSIPLAIIPAFDFLESPQNYLLRKIYEYISLIKSIPFTNIHAFTAI